ncbi:MAG: hypothetical protein DSY85_14650 [Marinomonas sp.]|nr:MAG: hypothetical protein DSY85_14650 [Marinomonas sp.]
MERRCELCNALLKGTKGNHPSSCISKYTLVRTEYMCWLNHASVIKQYCAQSIGGLNIRGERKQQVIKLFKRIGEGDLEQVLNQFSSHERSEIIEFSVIELRRKIVSSLSQLSAPVRPKLVEIDIPTDITPEMASLLSEFKTLLTRRFEILIDKGHSRSPNYVYRSMIKPISFCQFLTQEGFVAWGQIGKTQLASYLDQKGTRLSNCLKRFIKYAETRKNPFKKAPQTKRKRGGSALIETPRPQIVSPNELTSFIKALKNTLPQEEYLFAWFVCKLGLTVKKTNDLTLADININESGRCVIKPAEVWVALPKEIEKTVVLLADMQNPLWRNLEPSVLIHFKLFAGVIESLNGYTSRVFQGKTKILRSSAIYAMMEMGHLDRVTLKKTIGVSMPTLAKLERLFSVDVHRKLDPEFIKLRNAHILGEKDES